MDAKNSKIFKNPLSQTLGLVLQRMRNAIGVPSEEMALKLGLGASTYRMVEAGSATLQPGKALRVIKSFDKIEFDPLCKILVAIQVMESGVSTVEDMQTLAILLGEIEPNLQTLFRRFEPLWSTVKNDDPNKVSEAIKVGKLDLEVEIFLTSATLHQVKNEEILQTHVKSLLETTPPFYFDLALDLLDQLQGYPPRVSASELGRWEAKNKFKITHVYAIVERADHIMDLSHFNTFDYNFMWQNQFEAMRIIYLDGPSRGKGSKDVLKKFRKNINQYLTKHRLKYKHEIDEFEDVIKNVAIKCDPSQKIEFDKILEYGPNEKPISMRNLWLYKLRNGNIIGFIDNYTDEPAGPKAQTFYGTSLSYLETATKLQQIEEIWNALE